jgi:hypothetical protein
VARTARRFGNWHTIYTRTNRWSRKCDLDRVFEKLQLKQTVRIRMEAFSLDPTSVKVHPDGAGAGACDRYNGRVQKTDHKRNEIERLFRRLKGYRRILALIQKLDCVFLLFSASL